jgi:xanthine dehydrogenase accessory factor
MTPGSRAWLPAVIARLTQVPAVVRIVVAQVQGSTPREPGACMLLDAAQTTGTIGGGRLEWEAVGAARAMLQQGARAARLMNRVLGVDLGQCCGGVVAVWLECFPRACLPQLVALAGELTAAPAVLSTVAGAAGVRQVLDAGDRMAATLRCLPRQQATPRVLRTRDGQVTFLERLDGEDPPVWLYGAGHVGRSLAGMLVQLPLRLQWLDSRPGQFPAGAEAYSRVLPEPELIGTAAAAPPGTLFLVMTHDHALDFDLCRAVLRREEAAWLGLIGSQSKAARFRSRLRRAGFPEQDIARLVCPVGIAGVQSKWPAAIAVAIAAQLMQILSQNPQGATGVHAGGGGEASCAAGDCDSCGRAARPAKGILVTAT